MKVAFVCDSGTARNVQELRELGIFSCPLQISDENQNYLELEDKSIEEIYEKVDKGEMLKTSLPPMGVINEVIEEIQFMGYDTVFCVPICSGLSSTYNAFRLACDEAGLRFVFVDTHVTAEVEFHCITEAKRMYEEGKSLEYIISKLEEVIESASTYLLPVNLMHLARGGRLTPMAARLAGLLKIQPVLLVNKTTSGKIDVVEKVRTLNRAMDHVIDFMKQSGVDENYDVFVAYVKETKDCNKMLDKIKAAFPTANSQLIPLISTVGCHTGIGCVAIQYYKRVQE